MRCYLERKQITFFLTIFHFVLLFIVYLSQQQLNMQNMIDTIKSTDFNSSEGIVEAWRGNTMIASLNVYTDVLKVYVPFNSIWDEGEIEEEKQDLKKFLFKAYEEAQDLQFTN